LDRAGKQYWNRVWIEHGGLTATGFREFASRDYVFRRFRAYFHELFAKVHTRNMTLLEIGCAGSIWLPYLAQEFGFTVCGIDYSEAGCTLAEQNLTKAGVTGEVICGDFFSPPDHFIEAFDVVVSFGVAEHFSDTSRCLGAFSRFLKPGGLLATNIPNLCGLNGLIQKVINRPVFDVHVPLDRNDLVRAHQANGFQTISCQYFLFLNLGVLNFENWKGGPLYSMASRVRTLINRIAWLCEEALPFLRPNRWTSPYIHCLAVKEGARCEDNPFLGRA
jgi:2-polyprenyl-3-methyl-5-hydroxy-6-metoxy-1,4-benzoquinol methylase